jgi:hypothetical protein
MRLFRMTRAARFSNAIDQYGHRGTRFRAGIRPPMILTAADWVPQVADALLIGGALKGGRADERVLAQSVFPGSEAIKLMAGLVG